MRRRSVPPLICAYATHLLRVRHEHVARVGRDLVRQEHGDIELGRDLDELADVLAELLLALGELAAAAELDAEEAHDAVHDEQLDRLVGVRDLGRHGLQHLVLLLVVLAARDEHVVEHLVAVEPEALHGDLGHALGPEGVLRVDDEHLARRAAVLARQLARHGERRAQLRLARAELAEDLRSAGARCGRAAARRTADGRAAREGGRAGARVGGSAGLWAVVSGLWWYIGARLAAEVCTRVAAVCSAWAAAGA
jgi:hypothetical protein